MWPLVQQRPSGWDGPGCLSSVCSRSVTPTQVLARGPGSDHRRGGGHMAPQDQARRLLPGLECEVSSPDLVDPA